MKKIDVEIATGFFVLAGFLAIAYLSINIGKIDIVGRGSYPVYAEFPTIEGLKVGAIVEIAGVEVGRVNHISLEEYQAKVTMNIYKGVKLQEDSIASVRTKGLLGEKYVRITPGGLDEYIPPSGQIRETESPIDMEELIANFIFGKL